MLFCLVRPAERQIRAAKMDIDLLKHEIEINRLRKQIMSREMPPSILTFPPLVKFIYINTQFIYILHLIACTFTFISHFSACHVTFKVCLNLHRRNPEPQL